MRILNSVFLGILLASSGLAQATDQVSPPATTPPAAAQAEQSTSWLDRMSESFKEWTNKVPELTEDAKNYAAQLKDRWPGIKQDFSDKWQQGVDQTKDAGNKLADWFNDTFSTEKVQKAEAWLENFKAGTTEKVIDPLVPYLLSLRYPNPLDEWNQGYRRLFPVQITKDSHPVEVTLPLSWDLGSTVDMPKDRLISWRSDSGEGDMDISLIIVAQGSTQSSIIAGLEKQNPSASVTKLEDSSIERVEFKANGGDKNAAYYYAIPLNDSVVLLCAEIIAKPDQTPDQVTAELEKNTQFFDTVAKNVFIKP